MPPSVICATAMELLISQNGNYTASMIKCAIEKYVSPKAKHYDNIAF